MARSTDSYISPYSRLGLFPYGIYIHSMPFFLLGYAICGRAFAYLGVPPFFMGEILIMIGLVQVINSSLGFKVFLQIQSWFLLFFIFWSAMQTIPYIPEYGIMTLRDSVLWSYGFFAYVIAIVLVSQPPLLSVLIMRYQFFVQYFPYIALAGLVALTFFNKVVFDIGRFVQMKPGDAMVHLAAVTAFAACGLAGRRRPSWIIAVVGTLIVAGSAGRGGLMAFCTGLGLIMLFRFRHQSTWRTITAFTSAMIVLGLIITNIPTVEADKGEHVRQISPVQLFKNIASVFMPAEQWGLEGTKRYRLEWWDKIINYTFFGDYFINGKGYGINLSVADDQVLGGDTTLRSPHNAHLTILARSGVPGFILWILLNFVWLAGILKAVFNAKFAGKEEWEGVFCTLLAFYIAAIINSSFDVYLEGPMGGIWFWTVFGIGIASMHIYRTFPEMLIIDGGD